MGTSTHDDAAMAFARELTLWRERRGMSKKELAARIRFDSSYVSHIENRRYPPTVEFARRAEVALRSGNRIWQRFVAFTGTRPQRGKISDLGPVAAPPPAGSHLVVDDEVATLSLVDGWYECEFRRVLHSVGTEPITRHTVRIDIDRFPQSPARSMDFHGLHPLTLEEIDFRASIGADQPEPMVWRVIRSRDAFMEIDLRFASRGACLPLYPGDHTVVEYAYRVPAWKFGDWLQRDIRLPTRNLTIQLNLPTTSGLKVWGRETSFTSEATVNVAPRSRHPERVATYEWRVSQPQLRGQYRINWRYAEPQAAPMMP